MRRKKTLYTSNHQLTLLNFHKIQQKSRASKKDKLLLWCLGLFSLKISIKRFSNSRKADMDFSKLYRPFGIEFIKS